MVRQGPCREIREHTSDMDSVLTGAVLVASAQFPLHPNGNLTFLLVHRISLNFSDGNGIGTL